MQVLYYIQNLNKTPIKRIFPQFTLVLISPFSTGARNKQMALYAALATITLSPVSVSCT